MKPQDCHLLSVAFVKHILRVASGKKPYVDRQFPGEEERSKKFLHSTSFQMVCEGVNLNPQYLIEKLNKE